MMELAWAESAIAPARSTIGSRASKVSDLERAIAFYSGVLGFEVMQRMGTSAAFLSAGGYHHHIGLNTWESRGGKPPAPGNTGLYHFAIRYPDRAALGDALRRLQAGQCGTRRRERSWRQRGALSDAILTATASSSIATDRARNGHAPRTADWTMVTGPLDLECVCCGRPRRRPRPRRRDGTPGHSLRRQPAQPGTQQLVEWRRRQLSDLRTPLLNLHKALLDDARAAYEMDRGQRRFERESAAARDQRSVVCVAALGVGADRPHRRDDRRRLSGD